MNKYFLIKIIKLIRPKYYNRISWVLIIGGLSLLSKPLWIEIASLFFGNFKWSFIGKNDWFLGLIVIIITLIYNVTNRILDFRHESKDEPAYKNIKQKRFNDFGVLCQNLLPLLKDNESIFKNCGPNSGAQETSKLRTDLTVWHKLRENSILPNNATIKQLVSLNKDQIPSQYQDLFNRLIIHIDAFSSHIKNPKFDYSQHQFPQKITKIITKECYNYSRRDKSLLQIRKWLSKKLKKKHISNAFIFGSVLLYPSKARDIDIAILSKSNSLETIEDFKFEFKIKFKKPLHVSFFEETEQDHFNKFGDKNQYKEYL